MLIYSVLWNFEQPKKGTKYHHLCPTYWISFRGNYNKLSYSNYIKKEKVSQSLEAVPEARDKRRRKDKGMGRGRMVIWFVNRAMKSAWIIYYFNFTAISNSTFSGKINSMATDQKLIRRLTFWRDVKRHYYFRHPEIKKGKIRVYCNNYVNITNCRCLINLFMENGCLDANSIIMSCVFSDCYV